MKTVISTVVGAVVSVFCTGIVVMSCISYANANVASESMFVMRYEPLMAETETVDVSNEGQDNVVEENVDIDNAEEVIEDEPIKVEVIEPEVSKDVTENSVETEEIIEETPIPTQTEKPDIEKIIIEDTPVSESVASATAEIPVEPSESVVSESVSVNYVSGQLPLGDYAIGAYVGRLTIPSVGIDVAVYHSNSQSAVDAMDSAGAYYGYESQPDYANYAFVIADHNFQGFNAIKNCVIGTEAYIITANGTYTYVCDRIIPNGHNLGNGILDENYNMVYNQNNGGMWLQTCNDTWKNDTLVHFNYQ